MANKDNAILSNQLGTEIGKPGTWISGGFITHEEYNQKLLWRRGIDIFERMRKSDASIQALLKVCKHPLLAATWDIESADDNDTDNEIAAFIKGELFDRNVTWGKFLQDALGKLDFGFSVFEKTYELFDYNGESRIGIQNLGWRKQWSILRWEANGQPGVTQQLIGDTVAIPQDKLLVFVNDREGDNYQGVSLLRYAYKDWDIKQYIENLMRVAAERSIGFPIVEMADTANKRDEEKVDELMKNFRAGTSNYIRFPLGKYKFTWQEVKTNIETDLIPILEYLQHEIDKSVLAQFLDLAGSRSGGSSGSHALSADQSQLFEKALEAVANEIVGEVNENLIQQLCDLNFSKLPNGYPKLTFSNIGDQNLTEKGTYLNQLASVDLITPDPDIENMLRQWADLPDLPDDIYDDYDNRTKAQSQALPLVNGQPVDPATGLPVPGATIPARTPTGRNKPGNKLPGDQTNRQTRTNMKKDDANSPTPESSSYSSTKASENLSNYRNSLIAAVMSDEGN
jgi:hypothetical protein